MAASAPIRRIEEAPGTYRTAQGEERGQFFAVPYALMPCVFRAYDLLFEADCHLLLYVWQRTGGWPKLTGYRPQRITIPELMNGRVGYQHDYGAHKCRQALLDAKDRMIWLGLLYEEAERPGDPRSPRRYALIDPSNPGRGPYQTTDGTWEIRLMDGAGGLRYPIDPASLPDRPATPEQYRGLLDRLDAGLLDRSGWSILQTSTGLLDRPEKTRRAFPQKAPQAGIDNSLDNISRKENLDKGAAYAAPISADSQRKNKGLLDNIPSGISIAKNNENTARSDNEALPQAQQLTNTGQAVLFPAIAMPAQPQPAEMQQRRVSSSRRDTRPTMKRKQPAQNELYAVWKQILPSATERQAKSTIIGLAELANPEKMMGYPVTPGELPALMYQVMDWRDRNTNEHYTPTPRLLAEWIDKIRRQVANTPAPRVRAWLNWQMQQVEEAPGVANELVRLIELVQAFDPYLRGDPSAVPSTALDVGEVPVRATITEVPDSELPDEAIAMEEVEDFSWTARLQQFVPDGDRKRDCTSQRDVRMLWGFVRDALRPGLNTARRQHLDALIPAWDPEHPSDLLLLGSSDYGVRFVELTLLRDIDEQVGKLLSRFFVRATLVVVPQWVIDQVGGTAQKE